MFAASRPQL